MKASRYFQTFSFRIGLILFLVLSTTLITLRILYYQQSVDNAYAEIQGTLSTHETVIGETMDSTGAATVNDLVTRIASETKDKNLFIAFDDNDKIYGNLFSWPSFKQANTWQEFFILRGDDEKPLHLYAKVIRYPDKSRLLLGYNLVRIDTLKAALLKVLAGNIALSFLLSFALSALVVLVLNRYLARINQTCQNVINGDLGNRVRVHSDFDQFDRLGGNINQMLDWINALLDTVRDSSNALAHDLRTPLSRHRLELRAVLESPKLPTELKDRLFAAIEHVDKLATMFDNILNIAKAESRSGTEMFTPVNLTGLARDVLDFYAPMIEAKSIALNTQVAETAAPILGDKQLLGQAFMNLIDNAVKYAPDGSAIDVSLTRGLRDICFEVRDRGEGIPPDMLEKAKERFFRLDKSRHTDGTGLGLSLVQAVMKLHRGELRLEDAGPGLKASLIFPA